MGNNFYVEKNYCEHCKRSDYEHIGKSSVGWVFHFQGTDQIRSLKQWYENICSPDVRRIVDENGREYTPKQILRVIYEKRGCGRINDDWRVIEIENPLIAGKYEKVRRKALKSVDYENEWLDENGNCFSSGDFC